jgi:hypothetical protein
MSKKVNCGHCGGSGYRAHNPDWKCGHCHGAGECDCGHCKLVAGQA